MFSAIIGFGALVALALIGWAIAELKGKACNYVQNEQEEAVDQQLAQQLHEKGFTELDINDVIESISIKGFKTT